MIATEHKLGEILRAFDQSHIATTIYHSIINIFTHTDSLRKVKLTKG